MTYKIPSDFEPPIQAQTGGSGAGLSFYRRWWRAVTNDGKSEVNFADTVCDLLEPDSGISLNVNSTQSGDAPEQTYVPLDDLLGSNSKVIYSADFNGGFDTVFDWVGVARDNGVYVDLPESRNVSFTDSSNANNHVNAEPDSSRLFIITDSNGSEGMIYSWQSRNNLKFDTSGKTVVIWPGVYSNVLPTNNVYTYSINIQSPFISLSSIGQSDWNIDNFGLGAKNPSGIILDSLEMRKVQGMCLIFSNKTKGDVIFGFLIGDTIFYAHRIIVNNQFGASGISQSIPFGNTNLPLKEEMEIIGDNVIRKVGLFSFNAGIWFSAKMDRTNEPSLITQQYSYGPVVYSVGSDNKNYYKPFVASTAESFVNVLQTDVDKPIISVKSINKTLWTFDKIKLTASGPDLDYGCYVKIIHNGVIAGPALFSEIPNPGSEVRYNLTHTSVTGGYLLYSGYIYANQEKYIEKSDLNDEFINNFSEKQIYYYDGLVVIGLQRDETLSVVVTPISTMPLLSYIDVSVSIAGGEIR